MSHRSTTHAVFTLLLGFQTAFGADRSTAEPASRSAPAYDASVPTPTVAGLAYGPHGRHVLDFWKSPAAGPNPLVMVIHGGGWKGGSKERIHRFVDTAALLDAGVSVAAINYRLMRHSGDETPPVKAPLTDAARALQFLRSNAERFEIDPLRIGSAGGSAGACSSLWLAFHDDLADPSNADPVLRESTRLACAAGLGAQTTLDPKQMVEWTPNSNYGGHAFGKKDFAEFLADRESLLSWIAEYSPYALVSAGDPPVAVFYNKPPAIGQRQKDPTHTSNFGAMLKERCDEVHVACDVFYSGATPRAVTDYLIAMLSASE